jgi:hypothetical protein
MQLDDPRWANLKGGYNLPYDPRPALQKLQSNTDTPTAWHELWEELHHQGDVGEASYATVPELVRIHRVRHHLDWNLYALVATIELARDDRRNPPLPGWLEAEYSQALAELAKIGISQLNSAKDNESVRAILAIVAIAKGLRVAGRMVLEYSEDELLEMENGPS